VTPEYILGLALLVIGAVASAFPRDRDYLTRLINLEIPGFGLLRVMLSYNEALALFTFAGVSVITTFVFVRVMEKREAA
jgi:energy-converting hydrogenase A subunit E